jgi:hypothetical protein
VIRRQAKAARCARRGEEDGAVFSRPQDEAFELMAEITGVNRGG